MGNEAFIMVCDITNDNGEQDLARIGDIIVDEKKQVILQMNPPMPFGGEGRVAWSKSKYGTFSNLSVYESLLDPNFNTCGTLFKNIWRWSCLQRGHLHSW